jgi:hypothetical protein
MRRFHATQRRRRINQNNNNIKFGWKRTSYVLAEEVEVRCAEEVGRVEVRDHVEGQASLLQMEHIHFQLLFLSSLEIHFKM